jgi:hypothetical protein
VGFATVRDCPSPPSDVGCAAVDTLVELDVAAMGKATTQAIVKAVRGKILAGAGCSIAGPAAFEKVFGVAAHGTEIFGFGRGSGGQGLAIRIDPANGEACLLEKDQGIPWAGAGISTLAPFAPPN